MQKVWTTSGNQASDGYGDVKWAKFGFVVGIFVEAEDVYVCAVTFYLRREIILVDLVKVKLRF